MSIADLEDRKSFKNKVLTADVFENDKNILKRLWDDAKDIEITLDFLEPNNIFYKKVHKIFNKLFKV